MIPAVLFALTFATTLWAGNVMAHGIPPERLDLWLALLRQDPAALLAGLTFSLPLLAILGVHEAGHYLAARRNGISVTPPYFIPFLPDPPLPGTMGAIIRLRSAFPDRNALMDVGAAGPLCGALVAVPVLVFGLSLSRVAPLAGAGPRVELGGSLLLAGLERLVVGPLPAGHDVFLHPAALAGWLGLFITALNLIPSGQLDGGHVAYALFGDRYEEPARLVPYALLLLGLLWPGWFLWAALLFVLGTRHPRPVFPEVPLSPGRRRLGAAAALLFVLCFTPSPISFVR